MSNQIKLTIDMSDELVDKLLTVIALSGSQNPMKAMMMSMGGVAPSPKEKLAERPSMGFDVTQKKDGK